MNQLGVVKRHIACAEQAAVERNWMKASAGEQGITQQEAEHNFLKTMRPTTLSNRYTSTDEIANMVVDVCS